MTPAGVTAQWIAAARALGSMAEQPLFDDPFARGLAGFHGFALLRSLRFEGQMGPDAYLSVRTRFFDDRLRGPIGGAPLRQVVNLAAGMDTRAFRLEWPAGVVMFEIDRDDVFDWKERVLTSLHAQATVERRIVRRDLTTDWVSPLLDAGFDPVTPTAFLAEGLFMYFDEAAAHRLLAQIGALGAPGSWLGLDLPNRAMLTSPATASLMQRFRRSGAPWQFGRDDPVAWLQEYQWTATVVLPEEAGYGRCLPPPAPASAHVPRGMFVSATRDDAPMPAT